MVLFLIEILRMFMVDRYTKFTVHGPKNLLFIYVNHHQRNIARKSEVSLVLELLVLALE